MKDSRRDWLKWVAAGFALVATASAEYQLARNLGWNPVLAATVPGALDAYTVRALWARREVLTAVLAMVGVNATSHIVTASTHGDLSRIDVALLTAVSSIPPLVLWRVHSLDSPGEWRERKLHELEAVPGPGEQEGVRTARVGECVHSVPLTSSCGECNPPVEEQSGEPTPVDEYADDALSRVFPDYVPEAWGTAGTAGTAKERAEERWGTPQVTAFPPVPRTLPEGYEAEEPVPDPDPLMPRVRELAGEQEGTPTVAYLKQELSVGTARASKLRRTWIEENGGTS